MAGNDINMLSDTFELYMRKGKEAKDKGNLALAKRNFLLASETMMKMAKQILSDDEFKLICLRFGFNKKAIAYTSDQLATIFKTSVKKVQIVLNRILLKLKQNLKREEWII